MEERVLRSAKMYFKHQVDIEKFKAETFEKLERVNSININKIIHKPKLFLGAALLLLIVFFSSPTISPSFAEKILSNIPFFGGDNHNVVELENHPDEVGAYLDLVSAFNKRDIDAYLGSYSKNVPSVALNNYKSDYTSGVKEKEKFSAKLTLLNTDKKTSVLLSEEEHAFNAYVRYKLKAFIILENEDGEWKVLEKIPFSKVDDKNRTLFDKSNEVKRQIDEKYNKDL
jgi:hypothetical protein